MSRRFINRLIVLSFLALVSYAITWAVRSGSTSGLILSLVSLAAGIHFIYLLKQLARGAESDPEL
ncbi:MAG: hypothetical protein EOO09_18210 [Chitinophagaceae bacterium]|nr:MAG: hypothetical protein EOO09_18210 [Chitinophagaceae bacterium]